MLSLKECDETIRRLEHNIRLFRSQPQEYLQEYILHMEHLIEAYEKEREKALGRPTKREENPERGAYNIW